MTKRLSELSGLAILAVVLTHACGWGQISIFLWAHRYRSVISPNWDRIGSLDYYALLTIRQICMFAVPAFLFISGFFIAFAAIGSQNTLKWKVIKVRIVSLLVPYFIWSLIVFLLDYLQGTVLSPLGYITTFFTVGAIGPYYFIPLLCYLYLLSPYIIRFAKARWKLALGVSIIIQLFAISLRYLTFIGIQIPNSEFWLQMTPTWAPPIWIFFFVSGIIVRLHLKSFTSWLERNKKIIFGLTSILFIFALYESDLILRSHLGWGANFDEISFHLFSTSAILSLLALKRIPFSKNITKLSSKTYGIYLVHMISMLILSKIIYQFAPWIFSYQIIFVPILFIFGLGTPLFLMTILEKSSARVYYRYIFG